MYYQTKANQRTKKSNGESYKTLKQINFTTNGK